MSFVKLKNNYQTYKADFVKNTGLDADKNVELYLEYFKARSLDTSMQLLASISYDITAQITQPENFKKEIHGLIRSLKEDKLL